MVKATTTGETCCYIGCTKSYLTDKDTKFFNFPDDLERRKKWITNSGNPELGSIADRQLRRKKICINHFAPSAFSGVSGDKNSLKDSAVPIPSQKATASSPATTVTAKGSVATPVTPTKDISPKPSTSTPVSKSEVSVSETPTIKRGRGRPPKIKQEVVIKCEPEDDEETEGQQMPVLTPDIVKEKNTPTRADSRKAILTISGTPTKEKSVVAAVVPASSVTKQKLAVSTPEANDKEIPTLSKEKAVVQSDRAMTPVPGKAKSKQAQTLANTKAKPVATPATAKEKKASALVTPKEKQGTPKEKAVAAAVTAKGKQVSTPVTSKDKTVAAPLTTKEKHVPTASESTKQKPVATPSVAKQKAGATPSVAKQKLGTTPGTPKEKPTVAPKTAKEKQGAMESSAIKNSVIAMSSAVKDKTVATPDTSKEKSAVGQDNAKDMSKAEDSMIFNEKDVAEINNTVAAFENAQKRKRKKLSKTEKDLKTKLRRIAVDIIQPNTDVMDVESSSSGAEDVNEEASQSLDSSEDEEKKTNTVDNREFERFHKTCKLNCILPESWNLGAVLWDPNKKMKVIPASEIDMSSDGTVRLKRSVQIYETMQTKVMVDGFDLTNRYDVKIVNGHLDVTRLVLRVARSKICCGIKSISAEDAMYFPDAVPRGTTFYSEACPVIISKQSMGPLCNNCHKLRNAIRRRKLEQKRAVEMRKSKRSSLHTVNSPFGKALYTLLSDLMTDESDPKKKKKRHTLYSRGHNVCLKDKEEVGDKNAPERATNSASISYIMQDIVSKMSLGKTPQEQQHQFFKSEDDQIGMQIINGQLDSNNELLVQNSAGDFTLAEGQEYELIGEVDPNTVQVVEMMKERPHSPNNIEIIEVDDQTLAHFTSQNMAGMFLQDGQIHVNMSEIDMNNPSMGQLLKVIGPHGY